MHIDKASAALAIAAYENATSAGAALTVAMSHPAALAPREAPSVADFSSRGPCVTDRAALLQPDILAPGEWGCCVAAGVWWATLPAVTDTEAGGRA